MINPGSDHVIGDTVFVEVDDVVRSWVIGNGGALDIFLDDALFNPGVGHFYDFNGARGEKRPFVRSCRCALIIGDRG